MARGKLQLAIRDDDLCFFTTWEELWQVYQPIWGRCPVSFSAIPFVSASPPFTDNVDSGHGRMPLGLNHRLVEILRSYVENGCAEINLHGYDHKYVIRSKRRIPECYWKSREQLYREVKEGKSYLEYLFGRPVQVFVPPSNSIDAKTVLAVEAAGMHLSADMNLGIDRPPSLSYVRGYLLRWWFRLHNGLPYPYPLRVGKHLELAYYSLTRASNAEHLRRDLHRCYSWSAPYVLAVHYWELKQLEPLRQLLFQLVEEAIILGFEPVRLSECFR
jgi:peptidoglycan/xylan/chitin deacetylase (PgdA/CDA1 family)